MPPLFPNLTPKTRCTPTAAYSGSAWAECGRHASVNPLLLELPLHFFDPALTGTAPRHYGREHYPIRKAEDQCQASEHQESMSDMADAHPVNSTQQRRNHEWHTCDHEDARPQKIFPHQHEPHKLNPNQNQQAMNARRDCGVNSGFLPNRRWRKQRIVARHRCRDGRALRLG